MLKWFYNRLVWFLQWLPYGFTFHRDRFSTLRGTSQVLTLMDKLGVCPKTLVDVGANRSQWAYWIHRRFPDITIYSFEPNRELSAANLGNRFNCALGRNSWEGQLTDEGQSSVMIHSEKETETVKVVRFDSLKVEIKHPALLKLDAESMTADALEGFGKRLAIFSVVVVELSSNYEPDQPARIWRRMLECGFMNCKLVDADFDMGECKSYDLVFWR